MGYRSDVRLVVSKEGYNELKEYVRKESLKFANDDYDYNLLNHCDDIYEKDNGDQVMLCWNYIKWYDNCYEDVKIMKNAIYHLEEHEFSYRFSRIGEEYDDIEESYYDSESDQDLDYPCIIRHFDDEYDGFEKIESGNE